MLDTSRLITAAVKVVVIMHYLFLDPRLSFGRRSAGFLLSFFRIAFSVRMLKAHAQLLLQFLLKVQTKIPCYITPFPSKWKEGIITSPPSHDIQLYFYFTILPHSKIENSSNFILFIIF